MVNPYSVEADVRKEAGGLYNTTDLPSQEVIDKIEAADREIDDITNREETGWLGTEYQFPRVQEISKILAAASSRARFDPDKAALQRAYGLMLLEKLAGEMGEAGVVIEQAEPQTFPKNPNAPWSRGRYSTTGIGEVTVDPDDIYEQDF